MSIPALAPAIVKPRHVWARVWAALAAAALGLLVATGTTTAQTVTPQTADTIAERVDPILAARDALRTRDGARLRQWRDVAVQAQHPLAQWADYWELSNRLRDAAPAEVDAFYERWSGTYVEDRLRNDWLLVLGQRRDWERFGSDFPRFRMNDDREVTCYAVLVDHLAGKPVADAARVAWQSQRDVDDGCRVMSQTLFDAGILTIDDVWTKVRLAAEQNRPRAAQAAGRLLGAPVAASIDELWARPEKYLRRQPDHGSRTRGELLALAIVRMAGADPDAAANWLERPIGAALPAATRSWAWSQLGRLSAQRLLPQARSHYRQAMALLPSSSGDRGVTDEVLAWQARAALRADPKDWALLVSAVDAMSPAGRADATWTYWQARGLESTAAEGPAGEPQRRRAAAQLESIADQMSFYGKLAAEDLGRPLALPSRPAPSSAAERDAARTHPGLNRSLALIGLGLRSEGVREWNFSLRGMDDRQLLAAAQRACDAQVWDRCINTSDRTRAEVDMAQRFPQPFRQAVIAQARETGVDPAYVYGLIRQESRFILDARSSVGASGLMQLMPATAKWTARKIGLPFTADMVTDRDVNLKLGMAYLKLVLDDFDGSQALAAAAYNAGPNRPRRWREGPSVEAAAWAENIPFTETRDYVKKVLSNAAYYAALITGDPVTLKPRLGDRIGPRAPDARAPDRDLP